MTFISPNLRFQLESQAKHDSNENSTKYHALQLRSPKVRFVGQLSKRASFMMALKYKAPAFCAAFLIKVDVFSGTTSLIFVLLSLKQSRSLLALPLLSHTLLRIILCQRSVYGISFIGHLSM